MEVTREANFEKVRTNELTIHEITAFSENVTNDNSICKKFFQVQKQPSKVPPLRVVPGFTAQCYQKNVVTDSPPKIIVRKSSIGKTLFRMYYNRGDIPVCLEFRNRNKISWKVSEFNEMRWKKFSILTTCTRH